MYPAGACLFSFFALPALTGSGQSETVSVLRMKQAVATGTQLTADMVETVSVPGNLIEGGISDTALAVGQYAAANLYAGDYLTPEKLTATLAEQSLFSAGEAKGKTVIISDPAVIGIGHIRTAAARRYRDSHRYTARLRQPDTRR